MGYIKNIPTLKGDNYIKWKRKLDLTFILGEVDWIVTTSCPTKPEAPVTGVMRLMLHGRLESWTLLP
jgi:hypothetical protein